MVLGAERLGKLFRFHPKLRGDLCRSFFCFLSAVLRFTVSTEIIGYLLMGIFVVMTVLREILFCTMDAKGV